MPRFLVALVAAVAVSSLTFTVAAVLWDGGRLDGALLLWTVPAFAGLSAVVLSVAGALTRGRPGRLLLVAAGVSVMGGLWVGVMTAGVTASFGLGEATLLGTTVLGGGLLPGAAVFGRVDRRPARPAG